MIQNWIFVTVPSDVLSHNVACWQSKWGIVLNGKTKINLLKLSYIFSPSLSLLFHSALVFNFSSPTLFENQNPVLATKRHNRLTHHITTGLSNCAVSVYFKKETVPRGSG